VLVAVAVFLGAADVRSGESPAGDGAGVYADMVRVGPGSYRSLFTDAPDDMRVEVDAFYLDRFPVTNGEFAEFVVQHPEWARGTIKTVFADASYLAQLDSEPLASIRDQPVTNVSWFAATAYCESRGKRLPTVDEWELAGQASRDAADGTQDPAYRQQILEWYGKPAIMRLPDVRDTEANYWGVHGMHGVVWELVDDFNSALVTGESRADSQLESKLYCGAGAAASVDPGDYAAFMRYAMRSSYEGDYTMKSMGFRCATDAQ
jgi:formylglycine-generating enzyme required for sulfatase activity